LTDTAAAIGLRIVVTSRKGFFARYIEPSLSGYSFKKVDVTPFSDAEMHVALAQIGQTIDDIPLTVRDFIRNPRVFSVAASLLDRLNSDELSHERLLFEYWRKRQEERGE